MGLYLAKRITRPVQLLAAGAREIGAGRLDHRIEPETRDEFGSLVEAFNTMAGELAASQRKLELSRGDLERKNVEVDERRRYIETVLERIATGVVSIAADQRIETVNTAALRLLGLEHNVTGRVADEVFDREDLRPLQQIIRKAQQGSAEPAGQEVALAREGREIHLAAAATQLPTEGTRPRRGRSGVRRCDAADPHAARGGLARRRAAAGARDQESADPDPAECRAPAPPVRHGPAGRAGADRGVHVDDRDRGRLAQGAGRRVRAVCADAGAESDPDGPEPGAVGHARALQRSAEGDRPRAAARDRPAARQDRRRNRSVGSSSISSTMRSKRSAGPPPVEGRMGRFRRSRSAPPTTRRTAWSGSPWATTGPGSPPRTERSCSCRTTRRSGGGAVSASRSCGASLRSTAAPSTWPTTYHRGLCSP